MINLFNKRKILLPLLLSLAWVGEILEMLARQYEELCLTVLVVGIVITLFSLLTAFTDHLLFACLGTCLGIAGVVLLLGFPSYVPFVAILFLVLSLAYEILCLVFKIKEKKLQK